MLSEQPVFSNGISNFTELEKAVCFVYFVTCLLDFVFRLLTE